MQFKTFLLESYFDKYEFSTKYTLSSSDVESWDLKDILVLANHEELTLWNSQRFGYTETSGSPSLRQMITTIFYPGFNNDNILCFAGAQEGIFCTLLTLCTKDDHVIVLTPCYQSLQEIPRSIGCDVTEIQLEEANNWKIDIEKIKQAIRPTTKVVIINFPHNPTGQIISSHEMISLVELLAKNNIWLFSDEVYRLLGNQNVEWGMPAATLYNKALSLGVMSKAFGMPGLRIGWLACQDTTILNAIKRTKYYTSLCNSGPSEIIATIALRNADTILYRNNTIVAQNSKILDHFITEYSELFSWVQPQGGCTGFVKLKLQEPINAFCDRLIETEKILLLPGSVYNITSNHFRIGFGRKNMPEALERFKHYIKRFYL